MKVKGFEIEVAIAEKGYNRAEFGRLCGVTPQTMAKAIKNNSAKMLTVVKIAKGLGVSVTDLIVKED